MKSPTSKWYWPCQQEISRKMLTLSSDENGVPHQMIHAALYTRSAHHSCPTAESPQPYPPQGALGHAPEEASKVHMHPQPYWKRITSRGSWHWNHTPWKLCWCDSFSHWMACFLWAFACKLAVSSKSWKYPCSKAARNNVESMFFVRGSANWSEVEIHLKTQCSWQRSLINKTSSVVRFPRNLAWLCG